MTDDPFSDMSAVATRSEPEQGLDRAGPLANPFQGEPQDGGGGAPAAAPSSDDPFADMASIPSGSSAKGAFLRSAERGVLPAAGGLVGAGAGAETGAIIGAFGGPFAPITVPVGAFVGGVAGGIGGSMATERAQDYALSKAPDTWKEALGQDERQQKLDESQHPYASFMGGIAPYALTMRPGGFGGAAAKLPENATAFQRIMANPTTARIFGGAAMGGIELGSEAIHGESPDWTKIAIATGFGTIFNKPMKLNELLTGVGARPFQRFGAAAPAPVTVAQTGDAKVMGPGVTEEVFQGSHEQAPEAAMSSQDAARAEAPPGPPQPDIHDIVRRMEPELFEEYDRLSAHRDAARAWVDRSNNPPDEDFASLAQQRGALEEKLAAVPISGAGRNLPEARRLRAQIRGVQAQEAALQARKDAFAAGEGEDTLEAGIARQHLLSADYAMRDLAPQISAAYRRAAEAVSGDTVPPIDQPTPEASAPAPEPFKSLADMIAARDGASSEPSVTSAPPQSAGEAPVPPQSEASPTLLETARSPEQQRAAIAADVTQRLMRVGRPEEEAVAIGNLLAARYEARAARMGGALGTAEELYANQGAAIKGPVGRASLPAGAGVAVRSPRQASSRPGAPQSLVAFLRAAGGLKDEGGNLRAAEMHKQFPGLVNNKRGQSLDRAREMAAEAGYLGADTTRAVAETSVNDLLEALDRHPAYSVHDEQRLAAMHDAAERRHFEELARTSPQKLADAYRQEHQPVYEQTEYPDGFFDGVDYFQSAKEDSPINVLRQMGGALLEGPDGDEFVLASMRRRPGMNFGGAPREIVGYHGTGAPDFDRFDPNAGHIETERGANFFTTDPTFADVYSSMGGAAARIYKVRIDPGRSRIFDIPKILLGDEGGPFLSEMRRAWIDGMQKRGIDLEARSAEIERAWQETVDRIYADLKEQGDLNAMFETGRSAWGERLPLDIIDKRNQKPLTSAFDGAITGAVLRMAKRKGLDTAVIRGMREGPDSARDQVMVLNPDRIRPFWMAPEELTAATDQAAQDVLAMVRAYHGSPHDFDRFDLSKVGTGEGAQAYGHGLYFAENRRIAESYRVELSDEGGGHLYEVAIDREPEHFLDWDASLNEQSSFIKEKLAPIIEKYAGPASEAPDDWSFAAYAHHGLLSGEALFRELRSRGIAKPAISKEMEDAGIAGIRYLDHDARHGGSGPRNYVVFNDKDIAITHRNGEPVTPAERDNVLAMARRKPAEGEAASSEAPKPDLTLRNPRTGAETQAQDVAPLADLLKRHAAGASADPLLRATTLVMGDRLTKTIGDMPVYSVGRAEMRALAEGRMKIRAGMEPGGYFDPRAGHIVMLDDVLRNPDEALRTLVHEGLHGAFMRTIDGSESARNVIDFLRTTATAVHFERGGEATDHYGLTNAHEFVSEAFSNPEFQRFLASVPADDRMVKAFGLDAAPGNSLWDVFVAAVRKILGFAPDQHTLLDAAMRIGKLLDEKRASGGIDNQSGALLPIEREHSQGARGKIRFVDGQRPVITLMRDANASTFIHETGHQWLEELLSDAAHPAAPDGLRTDAQTVRDWLGVGEGDDLKTRHHEKFARGFEQYMREGIAPSPGLASVFAKFRDWLTSIYQTIKSLGTPINDDIRAVFDRMLSTDPQRTVIAPERPGGPSLADIHEADAAHTEPHEAEPAMDRVIAERDRAIVEPPLDIRDEVTATVSQAEAARGEPGPGTGTQPAGQDQPSAGGRGQVDGDRGNAGAQPQSGDVGARHSALLGGGGDVGTEGDGLREPGDGRADRAGDRNGHGLAPSPTPVFGRRESPFVDKAGNIRVDNLTTREDVAQAIHEAADANDDFIGDRRGVITDGQVLDLADALGMDAAKLNQRKIGQAFNAEQVMAARKLLIQSATGVADAMKKAATGTDEDVMAYAMAKDRHQMIQAQVAGITAEAGRALRAFRSIAGEGSQEAMQADLFIRQATGKTLFQLREEAKLGSELDTPQKVSKFMQDAQKPGFGRMLLEYWINGLISGPATHTTYMIGNTLLSLNKMGPETAAAAAIGSLRKAMGREGETVQAGEVGAQLRGAVERLPSTLKAALESFAAGVTTELPGERSDPRQGSLPLQPYGDMATAPKLDETATYHDAMSTAFGLMRGLRDGIVSGASTIAAGGVEGAPLLGTRASPLGSIPDVTYRGVNVLPVGSAVRLPGRFIAAIHTLFRATNYSASKAALAYRQAVSEGLEGNALAARVGDLRADPTEDMMESARADATALTLMGQGSEFTQALGKLTNTNIFGFPLLKFVSPFVHIASNVIDESLVKRTPLGWLSPELRQDLLGANGTIAQDRAQGRMLVGTAMSLVFGGLAAEGLISGSGPDDPREAAMWRLAGNQAHSVRVGDVWYDVHRLGPLGMLMGVAADMYVVSHLASRGDMLTAAAALQHAYTQNIFDESFMKGPADLIKAVEDPGRYGEGYVRSFASSFVPYSVGMGQIARATDPYSRQARTVMDEIKAKVPGLSTSLYPRRDIWGQPMPTQDALISKGVTAIYETQISRDPVNRAMLEIGIHPGPVDKKIRNVELTPQEYDDYARVAGTTLKQRLDMIVTSPDWRSWPMASKITVVNEVVRQSREAASGYVMMKYPHIAHDATDAKLAKLQGPKPE